MQHLLLFLFLLLPVSLFSAQRERPVIVKVEPRTLVQHTDLFHDKTIPITITGRNLWPEEDDNTRFGKRTVQVLLRRSSGGYVQLPEAVKGRDNDLQTLKTVFQAREFLKLTGSLQVMVKTENQGSHPFALSIIPPPQRSPRITSLSPSTFSLGKGPFTFRLYATGLDSPDRTSLRINNLPVPITAFDLHQGKIEATLPSALQNKEGTYRVQIVTRRGTSLPEQISIQNIEGAIFPTVRDPYETQTPLAPITPQKP